MARFIPTRLKKFIVFISYSYKFQASRPTVFLTNFVSFNADKCQNNSMRRERIHHREQRGHGEISLKTINPQIKGG
jgi:hypothetical protein